MAKRIYLLLGSRYHVSRTQKMSWLLEHLNQPVVANLQQVIILLSSLTTCG